jgi:hypothetical protein
MDTDMDADLVRSMLDCAGTTSPREYEDVSFRCVQMGQPYE